MYYNEEVKYEKVDFDDMEDSQLKLNSQGGWIAMLQHYFLTAWIPPQDGTNLVYSIANTSQQPATYTIGMWSENALVSPGNSTEFTSQGVEQDSAFSLSTFSIGQPGTADLLGRGPKFRS